MRKGFCLLLLLVLVWATTPLAGEPAEPIRVGVYQNEPLVFIDGDGRPRGIYIDILEYVASREGWSIRYVRCIRSECLDMLESGELDLLTGIGYISERNRRFDFSKETILINWGQIYTAKGTNIRSITDLEGKKVAVLRSDLYHDEFKHIVSAFNIHCEFREMDGYDQVMNAVESGYVDAGLTSRMFGIRHEGEYSVYKSAIICCPVQVRFAVPKGKNARIIEALDAYQAAMREDEGSVYHRSLDRWLTATDGIRIPKWIFWTGVACAGLLLLFFLGNLTLRAQVRARTRELQKEILEHKRTAEQLKGSEERYRNLFENAAVGIYRTTPDGRILMANPALVRMLGYSSFEELAERNVEEDQVYYDVPRSVIKRKLESEGEIIGLEARWVRRDGSTIFVRENARAQRDESGKVIYYEGIVEDITERRKAEESLKQATAKMKAILDAIPDLMFVISEDGTFQDYKATRLEDLFVPTDKFLGRNIREVLPEDLAEKTMRHVAKALQTGSVQSFEYELELAGEVRFFEARMSPSGTGEVLSIVRDITDRKKAEERMRLLSSIIQQTTEGVALMDMDGRIVFVNHAFAAMHGYSPDELAGKHISILHTPEQMPAVEAANEQVKLTGEFSGEIWHTRRDGSTFPALMRNSLLMDDQGEPVGVIAAVRDITDLKQTEQKLAKEMNFLSTLINASPAFFVAISPEGKTIMMNEAMLNALGYEPDEVVGTDYMSTFVPEDEHKTLSEVFGTLVDRKRPTVNENYVMTKDGRRLLVEWHGSPVFDERGEIEFFFGVGIDITERKRAEEALRESEERYRSLVQLSKDAIFLIRPDGKVLFASPACESMFGYTPEEFTSSRGLVMRIMHPDSRPQLVEFYRYYREHGVFPERTMEWSWIRKDGQRIYTENMVTNIKDADGNTAGFMTIARDITRRKEVERELERLATIDSLTDVLNRRAGIELLQSHMQTAKREGAALTICYLDLDDFKEINDTFGHAAGDEALRTVAGILAGGVRESDAVCRMGGDEFLIIFPGCSRKEAESIWNGIARRIDELNAKGNRPYRIKFSRGFAEYDPETIESVDQLLSIADREMYIDKYF